MADNYEMGTVSPDLPTTPLTRKLLRMIDRWEHLHIWGSYIFEGKDPLLDKTRQALKWMEENKDLVNFLQEATRDKFSPHWEYYEFLSGLSYELHDDKVYFYFEESFPPGLDLILAQWVEHLGEEAPDFVKIEVSHLCSRTYPGQFGGSAILISRWGDVEYMSTADWSTQTQKKILEREGKE